MKPPVFSRLLYVLFILLPAVGGCVILLCLDELIETDVFDVVFVVIEGR